MLISRRRMMAVMAAMVPAMRIGRAMAIPAPSPTTVPTPEIEAGPFQATQESLQAYIVPDWFRDAKFGIWAHWGPQSAIEAGDWYARQMYMQGMRQYEYHVKTYGHPSQFGYKNTIPFWKAAKFDPDYLVGLYKQAGARYFQSMGVHHDNFDLWDSKFNRWNSVNMGPRRDIVGEFAKAARNHGLRFGISDHLWISYKWFSTSHGSDKMGPMAGVSYDGANADYWDLYHDTGKIYANLPWDDREIPEAWKAHWYLRIRDVLDKYQPDYMYCDGPLPFEQWGRAILAHMYNIGSRRTGGLTDAVYSSKPQSPEQTRYDTSMCVHDFERALPETPPANPWQTDTCIGNWHYDRGATYKTPKTIIDMLVDIVSRNGNLMLNFPLPNSGMLDFEELEILGAITKWMSVCSEAIHGTRPWKIYGVNAPVAQQAGRRGNARGPAGGSSENNRSALTAQDFRFTTKGDVLYAFSMGWPDRPALDIPPLALGGAQQVGRIGAVELLGGGPVKFSQDEKSLTVQLPEKAPCDYGVAFKINGAG